MPISACDLKRAVVLLAFLIAGTGCAQEEDDRPTGVPDEQPAMESGITVTMDDLSITLLDAFFWRDWMPGVDRPGPDGGSPLKGTIRVQVENTGDQMNQLDYRVAIVDEKGRSEPVAFQVQPDADGQVWDGTLAPTESRTFELITNEGPYSPIGSKVSAHITWIDKTGMESTVTTPESEIMQTF